MKMHFVSNKSSLPLWRHCLHPFNCITQTNLPTSWLLRLKLFAGKINLSTGWGFPLLTPLTAKLQLMVYSITGNGGQGVTGSKLVKSSKMWNPNLLGYCCISSPSMMKASVPTANMHQAWIIHRVHNHVYSAFQWYHSIIHRHREIYSNSTKWIMLFGHP